MGAVAIGLGRAVERSRLLAESLDLLARFIGLRFKLVAFQLHLEALAQPLLRRALLHQLIVDRFRLRAGATAPRRLAPDPTRRRLS